MRHLLVSYHTCPFEEPGRGLAGGMNVFLRGLLGGLGRRGVDTLVLTRGPGDAARSTEPLPGVRIVHAPCGWKDPPDRASALASLPRFVESARGLLGRPPAAFDAVSAHYWMSGIAARALGARPLVFSYHTVGARKAADAAPGGEPLSSARRDAERELAAQADAVVFLSREDLDETRRILPSLRGKGVVIPPGVDEAFRRPPPRRESRVAFGLGASAFVFAIAARDDPGKNVPSAVDAFRRLRAESRDAEPVLLVVGQGAPREATPEGVVFAGAVPHGRMPAVYAAADAVLCPSLYESFGLVPLEAMAAGVPPVVPDRGFWGARVRARGGGLAYAADAPDGLLGAMRALLSDATLRARLSGEARRAAARFTWGMCTDAWVRLLATVSTRGSRR